MVRLFQLVVFSVALATVAWLVTTVPDLGHVVLAKITEGGMWTALTVFILAAIALGYARRDTNGPPRPSREPPR